VKREVLRAEYRELASKGCVKELRRQGKVPAVLYGRGGDSVPLTVESSSLTQAMNTTAGMNVLLNLEIANEMPVTAMIKDLDRDILRTGQLNHVDLLRVSLQEKIEVTVPVVLSGEEQRPRDNGVIQQPLREVTILSVPGAIPESVPVDISGLSIGDSVTVGDIEFDAGFDVVTDAGEVLVSISAPRAAQEEIAPGEVAVKVEEKNSSEEKSK
jgi:large subunit ribosomal protein L25